MYTPTHFKETNTEKIRDFIRKNSFGILVTNNEKMLATHIPLELSPDGTRIHGHIARANEQGKALSADKEVLVIFQGPHTYISSSWYTQENVPTWNYIAAHVYGKVRLLSSEEMQDQLSNMVDKYEQNSINPVSLKKMSPEYISRMIKGIIGFEIMIERVEAAYKLSQNRNASDHENIITELQKRTDESSLLIAGAMKKH